MPRVHATGSPYWNTGVLTLMVAGVCVGYAAAEVADAVASPGAALALRLLALAGALSSLALFYARFVEPFWIVVTKRRVSFPVAGLRIAIVGDFHAGPHKRARFVAKAADRINRLKPDLIFLVGDFLFDHDADVEHLRPLERLRATLGVYGVVGNHDSSATHMPGGHHHTTRDRSDDIAALLEPLGIRFLRNASTTVTHGEKTIHLVGIDDLWMESCDMVKAFRGVPRGEPTMFLSHQPDVILDPASHRAHIIASGHTHGGQMRLPFVGSLTHMPQRLNKKFDHGVFSIGKNCTLAITHGIGETFVPLRLFARPEILLLETV